MRAKKNREVNIFSASVVDLFASGLGVFLIVAIIALVNQKKEAKRIGNPEQINEANEKIIIDLEQKLKAQKAELDQAKLLAEITSKSTEQGEASEKKESFESQLKIEQLSEQFNSIINKQKLQIKELVNEQSLNQNEIQELEKNLESLKSIYQAKDEQAMGLSVSKFEVGTKIQLNNVQFYAGTEKPIEPYASREIKELAKVLLENTNIKVEVSGHIFLSKDELEKGTVYDDSNLSGRRAQVVCQKLISLGVSQNRLKCLGYGGRRYLYLTNDQYSEKAQLNRRVEVEILAK